MNGIYKPTCQVISAGLSANVSYARYRVYLAYVCLGAIGHVRDCVTIRHVTVQLCPAVNV